GVVTWPQRKVQPIAAFGGLVAAERDDLRDQVASLTAERDRLRLQAGSGEVEIDQLREDVEHLRAERDDLQDALAEQTQRLLGELRRTEAERDATLGSLERLMDAPETSNTDLQASLRRVIRERDAAQALLVEEQQDHAATREELAEAKA